MTPEIALENLYKAGREIPLKAEIHEALANSYQVVLEALKKPKKT